MVRIVPDRIRIRIRQAYWHSEGKRIAALPTMPMDHKLQFHDRIGNPIFNKDVGSIPLKKLQRIKHHNPKNYATDVGHIY